MGGDRCSGEASLVQVGSEPSVGHPQEEVWQPIEEMSLKLKSTQGKDLESEPPPY